MAAPKKWVRKRSAATEAANRKAARAAARKILTNPGWGDLIKYHSPKNAAAARARGESNTLTPRQAARREYRDRLHASTVNDSYPAAAVDRHQHRRKTAGRVVGGRKFSLKRANVSRSKTTGRFVRRSA